MKLKKWMSYVVVFTVSMALVIGFMSLNKHILREGPEFVRWIIAVIAIIGTVIFYVFNKPVQADKHASKKKVIIRCLVNITIGTFIGYLLDIRGDRPPDFPFWIVISSIGSVYLWYSMQIGKKHNKNRANDHRNLYL